AIAAQLDQDQTTINTAKVNANSANYQTYVTAGSNQNIATIQSAGAAQLAQIVAGETENVNLATITGNEELENLQADAATTIGAQQENAETTAAGDAAAASESNGIWNAI